MHKTLGLGSGSGRPPAGGAAALLPQPSACLPAGAVQRAWRSCSLPWLRRGHRAAGCTTHMACLLAPGPTTARRCPTRWAAEERALQSSMHPAQWAPACMQAPAAACPSRRSACCPRVVCRAGRHLQLRLGTSDAAEPGGRRRLAAVRAAGQHPRQHHSGRGGGGGAVQPTGGLLVGRCGSACHGSHGGACTAACLLLLACGTANAPRPPPSPSLPRARSARACPCLTWPGCCRSCGGATAGGPDVG